MSSCCQRHLHGPLYYAMKRAAVAFCLLLLVVNFLILLMLQVTCGAAATVPPSAQMLAPAAGACMTAAKLEMNWSTVGISGNGNSCYCIVVK